MSMVPMNELFMQLGQAQTPGMPTAVPQGQMVNPAEVSNSFFNAGGVNPAELQPTPGAVQPTPGMVNDLSQPMGGIEGYLGRLSGNNLEGQALSDWQNIMGFASLLSSLGSGVAGKDSPIGGFATNLNKMQQGALMGQNARQGEGSLGGMQKASAEATAGQKEPSPSSMVTKTPSKQAQASATGNSGYGSLNPATFNSLVSSLANNPLSSWRV